MVMNAAPVALTDNPDTRHAPSRALLLALHANGWGVKWQQGSTALLVHRQFGTLELNANPDDPDRLIVLADGRQVPMRVAMQRARGEA